MLLETILYQFNCQKTMDSMNYCLFYYIVYSDNESNVMWYQSK